MTNRSLKVRSVASAAILGVALSTAAIGAPDAFAQGQTAGQTANTASANDSTITQTHGTLTIHKKGDPEFTGAPTGNEDKDNNVTGDPLDGVTFEIYKINDIDLSTNEGLAKAAGIKASDYLNDSGAADTNKVTSAGSKPTDNEGKADWDNLPIGAYLVVETGPKAGYTPAAPFIAFVPMTQGNADAQGTTWNYDVHAYPKNYEKPTPTKTVDDSNVQAGGVVVYTIEAPVQTIGQNQTRTQLTIRDTLDLKLTAPSANDLQEPIKTAPGVEGKTGIHVTATDGNGDEITLDTSDYEVTVEGQTVTVDFNEEGLAKLSNGSKVTLKIGAQVKELSGDAHIPNQALVFENDPNTGERNENNPSPTPFVDTFWGDLEFTKVDAENSSTELQGAKFEVYGSENETCDADDLVEGKKVTVNGQSEWTSGANGLVSIKGLHVNNYANASGDERAGQWAAYCLLETESPAGYELLAAPIRFVLTANTERDEDRQPGGVKLTVAGITLTSDYGDLTAEKSIVKNLKDTTPNLPLTGGLGVGILAAIGAGIVAAGAYFARRSAQQS